MSPLSNSIKNGPIKRFLINVKFKIFEDESEGSSRILEAHTF